MKRDFIVTGLDKITIQSVSSLSKPPEWQLTIDGVEASDEKAKIVNFQLANDYLTFHVETWSKGGFIVKTDTSAILPIAYEVTQVTKVDNALINYDLDIGSGNYARVVILIEDVIGQLKGQVHHYDLQAQAVTLKIVSLGGTAFEHQLWAKKI